MRIVKANNNAVGPRPRPSWDGGGRVDPAIQAAIEKRMARAFRLSCGHFTYIETQQGYAVWRPKRNKGGYFYFCETCNDWLHIMPKPKPPKLPETPLF